MKISDSPSVQGLLKRQIRFYLTNYSPCPYLPGQVERKVFTNLSVDDAEDLHDALTVVLAQIRRALSFTDLAEDFAKYCKRVNRH